MDEYNIYLKHPSEGIIGLHSVGLKDQIWTEIDTDGVETQRLGFKSIESWGNEYTSDFKLKGRGSFRIFQNIDDLAASLEREGYVRMDRGVPIESVEDKK